MRVATIGHRFADSDIEAQVLQPMGIQVDWLGPLPRDAALEAAHDADAVLLGLNFALDAPSLTRLRKCRAVIRYGVGVDNVDLHAAARLGMTVCNVPDYSIEEVANHAISLLMLFARRLDVWPAAVRAGRWGTALPGVRLRRLSRCTLGVVGAGRIGRAVIARAIPIWGRVLATDPAVGADDLKALGAEATTLDVLLAESDYITLHVPSAAETKNLIGARELDLMKPGVVIVNCSRGDLIDEAALAARIADGKVLGAGLDVFAMEPPSPDGLPGQARVWATPHIAWLSDESIVELRRRAAEEAGRILSGEPARNPVGPLALNGATPREA
ncbi:MAG TPA: C-terminal binding protein [bacterium]|nr:C-terminal binding protein [bacterium]